MNVPKPISAQLVLEGTLVFKDDSGNVVKTMDITLPVTLDQPQEVANEVANRSQG